MALEALELLAPLPSGRVGPIVSPVFSLLEEAAMVVENPWPLLAGMLMSRDQNLARRGRDVVLHRVTSRTLSVGLKEARLFAQCVESDGSPFADPTQLRKIGRILTHLHLQSPGQQNSLSYLYLFREDLKLRQLAARLLDLEGQPVHAELCERLLGLEEFSFLLPYLSFTRAGYRWRNSWRHWNGHFSTGLPVM